MLTSWIFFAVTAEVREVLVICQRVVLVLTQTGRMMCSRYWPHRGGKKAIQREEMQRRDVQLACQCENAAVTMSKRVESTVKVVEGIRGKEKV